MVSMKVNPGMKEVFRAGYGGVFPFASLCPLCCWDVLLSGAKDLVLWDGRG